MSSLTCEELAELARSRLETVAEGEPLDAFDTAMIELGLAASVTALDRDAIAFGVEKAFAAGASAVQVQEIVTLVSGLGVHSLMATSALIARVATAHGWDQTGALGEEQEALWRRHVGDDPYWIEFRAAMPGFLEALVRLSPAQFEAFFAYCKLPWTTRSVPARTRELVALACDATPAHRFAPGFLLHLDNAIKIGVGRRAILAALDLARHAPVHRGYR